MVNCLETLKDRSASDLSDRGLELVNDKADLAAPLLTETSASMKKVENTLLQIAYGERPRRR